MPELPEVETVVRALEPNLVGETITDFTRLWAKVTGDLEASEFSNNIVGQIIKSVGRQGKYIIFELNTGFLVCHLRMTGKLFVTAEKPKNQKHISAYFKIGNARYLLFKDVRKFGRITFHDNLDHLKNRLGIEPLSTEFTVNWLISNLKKHKRQMKAILLDQSFIAGLGNIYTDEVLWFAGIHPHTLSSNLSKKQGILLHRGIRSILSKAIEFKGTTIRDFEFQEGQTGSYLPELQVFDRKGKNCFRCEQIIEKLKVAGRGTYICGKCQKVPKN